MPSDTAAAISYLKFPFYLKKDQMEAEMRQYGIG
jgi:hypothetical protein